MLFPVIIRHLGTTSYQSTYEAMQRFTDSRQADTIDEIWLVEHFPVYTLGLASKPEHLLNTHDIEVVQTDRGGQVTYHGLGQLVVYILMDLKQRHWGVKRLVNALEQAIINYLAHYNIQAQRRDNAPGVYVADQKIASLGLRIRKGCSYHGLSLNINMDLHPFAGINPCGYAGLKMTQLTDFELNLDVDKAAQLFLPYLLGQLNYDMQNR